MAAFRAGPRMARPAVGAAATRARRQPGGDHQVQRLVADQARAFGRPGRLRKAASPAGGAAGSSPSSSRAPPCGGGSARSGAAPAGPTPASAPTAPSPAAHISARGRRVSRDSPGHCHALRLALPGRRRRRRVARRAARPRGAGRCGRHAARSRSRARRRCSPFTKFASAASTRQGRAWRRRSASGSGGQSEDAYILRHRLLRRFRVRSGPVLPLLEARQHGVRHRAGR